MHYRRIILLILLFILGFSSTEAQNRWMISGGIDLWKTDFNDAFQKGQIGMEVNYFVQQKLSINAGYEYLTDTVDYFAIGSRYYLFSFIFLRPRILINENKVDGSFGVGYKYFLSKRWRWESYLDFYVNDPELALRTGISYVFTK